MLGYLSKRVLMAVLVVWGAVTLVFFVAQIVPSDPARVALGIEATQEMLENYRREAGLDRPAYVQYGLYMGRLLKGDLGRSIVTRQPVVDDLRKYIPATLELMLVSLIWSIPLGIAVGVLAAARRGSLVDHGMRLFSVFGMSMPVFWYGLVLQLVFYLWLDILPSGRRLPVSLVAPPDVSGFLLIDSILAGKSRVFWEALRHLILPAVALSTVNFAAISRMTRSALMDVLQKDYVRTARAKGLTERVVLYRHALRTALVPILTETGLRIGAMLGGAVLTETIFAWPGLGRYAFFAVRNVDLPVIATFTLWSTLAFAAINLIVDLSYALVDPRISYAEQRGKGA